MAFLVIVKVVREFSSFLHCSNGLLDLVAQGFGMLRSAGETLVAPAS